MPSNAGTFPTPNPLHQSSRWSSQPRRCAPYFLLCSARRCLQSSTFGHTRYRTGKAPRSRTTCIAPALAQTAGSCWGLAGFFLLAFCASKRTRYVACTKRQLQSLSGAAMSRTGWLICHGATGARCPRLIAVVGCHDRIVFGTLALVFLVTKSALILHPKFWL